MFIIKVRDTLTARTRELVSESTYAILAAETGKWQTCVIRYRSLDEALHFVEKQSTRPNRGHRFGLVREYRVFEQNGRKLNLICEKKRD